MARMPASISKGSISSDSLDAEPVVDLRCEQRHAIRKRMSDFDVLRKYCPHVNEKKGEEAQIAGTSKKIRIIRQRKILLDMIKQSNEMLHQSDVILQKALKLTEQCRLLLDDVQDDSNGPPF